MELHSPTLRQIVDDAANDEWTVQYHTFIATFNPMFVGQLLDYIEKLEEGSLIDAETISKINKDTEIQDLLKRYNDLLLSVQKTVGLQDAYIATLQQALQNIDKLCTCNSWLENKIVEHVEKALTTTVPKKSPLLSNPLEELRSLGWSVAVHNDYKLDGKSMTFWLFTHPDGRYIKGEGVTDFEACTQAKDQLTTE